MIECQACGGEVESDLCRPEKWRRCRSCRNVYYREYAKRRPESVEKRKAWRQANADKVRAYGRKWEHKARAEGRKLIRDNRDATYVRSGARFQIFERDGGICWLCDEPVPREDFHLDHIIPVSKGGPTEPWNLRVAHPRCNRSKGNRARSFSLLGLSVICDPIPEPEPAMARDAITEALGGLPSVMIDGRWIVTDAKSVGPERRIPS